MIVRHGDSLCALILALHRGFPFTHDTSRDGGYLHYHKQQRLVPNIATAHYEQFGCPTALFLFARERLRDTL